jgi:hypothetical protein
MQLSVNKKFTTPVNRGVKTGQKFTTVSPSIRELSRQVLQRGKYRIGAKQKTSLRNDPPASCSSCLYFRFNRLAWWCCHPNHNRRITGPGCKGESYIDRYQKTLPGHAPSWPPPVPPEERIEAHAKENHYQ